MKLSLEPTEEFKEYVEKEKHGEVLKNLLHIKGKKLLEDAEADYVTYRLKEIAINLLRGHMITNIFWTCTNIFFKIYTNGQVSRES